MQSSTKLNQTKRKYNPDDKRNKRIASGTRTSRRQGTKSVVSRAAERRAARKAAEVRRQNRRIGRALSVGDALVLTEDS